MTQTTAPHSTAGAAPRAALVRCGAMAPEPAPRPVRRPRKAPEQPQEEPGPVPANDIPVVGLPFPVNRYRVMFSDGDVIDFLSYADHSGIREQMLDAHFGKRPKDDRDKRIEGIAHLGMVYEVKPPAVPYGGPRPQSP